MHPDQFRRPLPVVLLLAALLAGCGLRSSGPPELGHDRGAVPDLRGARVLLLPPQVVVGGHPDLEREIVFAFTQRGGEIDWVTPDRIRARLDRSPELDIAIDRLAIQPFLAGEMERFGDPLFGELYRLGVVEGADLAILPVQVRERTVGDPSVGAPTGAGPGGGDPDRASATRIEIVASLLQLRTGRVLWTGVLGGEVGPAGAIGPTATAAESLARRVVP